MNEFELINWLTKRLNKPSDKSRVPVGIGDDMAVINFRGGQLLLASDMLIENSHFTFEKASPKQVGHKAFARCLSDCAAMAGKPLAAIVSLAKPKHVTSDMLKEIFEGMDSLSQKFDCPIVGGDSSSSRDGLTIDVSLLGECNPNSPILRSTAQPGDYLYITGKLGGSILEKHLNFTPRIKEANWLANNIKISAMIDISDGLSSDLTHICDQSNCTAELFAHALDVIISSDARKLALTTNQAPLTHALNDGEDFELLLSTATPPTDLPDLPNDIKLFPIGRLTDPANETSGSKITLISPAGKTAPITPNGFSHF